MKHFFTLILGLFMSYLAVGQCDKCVKIAGAKIDYCYKNDLFPNQCAQFTEKAAFFYIQSKGKALKVNLPKERDLKYLASLSIDKTLKLSAVDILFIQEAVKTWQTEERTLAFKSGFNNTETGLGIKIVQEGTGALPEVGKNVIVHYTGFLENGQKFDSSVDRGQPFTFPLGQGRVIKGWDEGVAKLKIGTKAILKIPAELGYGSRGAGNVIPPNATLFFEVEVVGVE
jgi:FKBP-type peptidyl-prolyl cis-trans isomerase